MFELTIDESISSICDEKTDTLKLDKKSQKFGDGDKLEVCDIDNLPNYLKNNLDSFKEWIE